MGLIGVMTHRGRLLTRAATGPRVEGTAQYATVEGPWFRCRLFPDETPEGQGARGGRRVLVKGPHVVCAPRDLDGDAINPGEITPACMVELDLGLLGRQVWQVQSDPQPIQPKKRVMAYYFAVRRTETAGSDSNGF